MRRRDALSTLIGVLAALTLLAEPLSAKAGTGGYAQLVRKVAPSVVTVLVEEQHEAAGQRAVDRVTADADPDGFNAIERRFSGVHRGAAAGPPESVLGSGFVISTDGIIVTNHHVIKAARIVKVKLADGREVDAAVIGADAATDIALLKVHAGPLPALHLASSSRVSVGDPVIAIGNPFGLGQSVSAGIVSARGRSLENDPYIDFLQTDAAINQGNSGGPLLSADGAVVGVTSAILSPSGGSVGLGFAIPAETVASIVAELEAHGHVDRGYLGISVQAMTATLAKAINAPSPIAGALVTAVDADGPSAGTLQVGDLLLRIGNAPVSFSDLGKIMARLKPGSSSVATLRRDGTAQSITLRIGQLPDPPADPALSGDPETWVPNLALAVAKTTMSIRVALKANESAGLIITQLRHGGAGALAGMKIGDLITHAGSKVLSDVTDIADIGAPSAPAPLLLRIVRDGSPRFVAVTGEEER